MTHKPADHILDEFLAKHGVTVVGLPDFSELLGKMRTAMLAEAMPTMAELADMLRETFTADPEGATWEQAAESVLVLISERES